MINPTRVCYHLVAGRVRLRPVHGTTRKALRDIGVAVNADGWVYLSEEAAAEIQAAHQPADRYDRAVIVPWADLDRWLGIKRPLKEPKGRRPRRPAWARVDWRALAELMETELGTSKMRPRILDLLERVGMQRSANPELVAWAEQGGEGAP